AGPRRGARHGRQARRSAARAGGARRARPRQPGAHQSRDRRRPGAVVLETARIGVPQQPRADALSRDAARPLVRSRSLDARWYRRLGARVAVALTLLIGLSLGAVLIETTRVVRAKSLSHAAEELEVAQSAFYRLVDARAASASEVTRLVTELPVFRAHLSDARLATDPATIGQMADEYRRQLSAQFSIVTDGHGGWLGSPGWTGRPSPTLVASIDAASRGESDRTVLSIDDRLYLVVSEPALFG